MSRSKMFDDSLDAALKRGWSLDFVNTLVMRIAGNPRISFDMRIIAHGGGPDINRSYAASAFRLLDNLGPIHIVRSRSGISQGVSSGVLQLRQLDTFYSAHDARLAAACDIALVSLWRTGELPDVSLPKLPVLASSIVNEEYIAATWDIRHRCLAASTVVDPELFDEAREYLVEHQLIQASPIEPRKQYLLTDEGRHVVYELGGSTTEYRRESRRDRETMTSSRDSYTTNIHTNGGSAIVGSTGTVTGGTIIQAVTEQPVEFSSDVEALKKLQQILKGLDSDEHDDDLHEAMTLRKAAEANGGELPDEDHRGRAKVLWRRIAGAVGKAAPDAVAKALADFFTKLVVG